VWLELEQIVGSEQSLVCGRKFGCQHGTKGKAAAVVCRMGYLYHVGRRVVSQGVYARHLALAYGIDAKQIFRLILAAPTADWLYPQNMQKNWTTANYGPLWIPKKGAKLHLTLQNLPIYERPIRVYEGNDLQVRGGKIYINGKVSTSTLVQCSYWRMMKANRRAL
jgi:hypothetical protein